MIDNASINATEYLKNLTFDEFTKHSIYGIRIPKNSGLSIESGHICIQGFNLGNLAGLKREYIRDKLKEGQNWPSETYVNSRTTYLLRFRDMSIGDFVVNYRGKGDSTYIGLVSSDYRYIERPNLVYPGQNNEFVNNRDIVWLKEIPYHESDNVFANIFESIEHSVSVLNKKKEEIYKVLTGRIIYKEGGDDLMEHISMDDPGNPRNIILYGPPGTGKTYVTAEIAMKIIKGEKIDIDVLPEKRGEERERLMDDYNGMYEKGRIIFTTFHQNYGYEEFIGGIRPDTDSTGALKFKVEDGIFKKIADKARDDINNNYVIIIDEINRGNVSKIFGELITLIETDKREGKVNGKQNVNFIKARLPFAKDSDSPFTVPANLYIVGTMNSADKSISLIDVALRRRFEFMEIKPRGEFIEDLVLRVVFENINSQLVKKGSGTDLLIGHSYFIGKESKDLSDIMNRSIIPLLYEYFSDSEDEVRSIVQETVDSVRDCGIEINKKGGSKTFGRITVQQKTVVVE